MEIAYEQLAIVLLAIVLLSLGTAVVEKISFSLSQEHPKTLSYSLGMCYFSHVGREEILSIFSSGKNCSYKAVSKGFSLFDFKNAVVDEKCHPLPKVIVLGKEYFREGEEVFINKTDDFLIICPFEKDG